MKPDNIYELDVRNYRLKVVPEEIGRLSELERFLIHDNELSYLPPEIGNLLKLEILDLENNNITVLPESVGNLKKLESLVLNKNSLTQLPNTIGELVSLKKLWLNHNQIETINAEIVNLKNLEWLYINDNNLETIPQVIDSLINLRHLKLQNNKIYNIPDNICNIFPGDWECDKYECCEGGLYCNGEQYSYNECLQLCTEDNFGANSHCKCYGDQICSSSPRCLEIFSITDNAICDYDKDGVADKPSCLDIELGVQSCSECKPWEFYIEGTCADSMDYNILQNFLDLNRKAHYMYDADSNYIFSKDADGNIDYSDTLTTTFPDSAKDVLNTDWWEDSRLIKIVFANKSLYSQIPKNFGDLDKLEVLDLHSNQIVGRIPEELSNIRTLKELKLNSNQLTGSIPESIGMLSNLTKMKLENNLLGCYEYDYVCDPTGNDISCCLINCNDTEECIASIPQGLYNLSNLEYLYLNNNFLNHSISGEIGNLISLKVLRLNKNQFNGEIPITIGNLINLERVYFSNNYFSGTIPISICDLGLSQLHYFANYLCSPYPDSNCAGNIEGHQQSCIP